MKKSLKILVFILLIVIVCFISIITINKVKDSTTLKSTPEILPDSTIIVEQLQQLKHLETTSISFERIFTASQNQNEWFGAFGESMLFVAHGTVTAGVDLEKIQDNDVQVIDQKNILITLPDPEIFSVILDNDRSYVADHNLGILATANIKMESQIRSNAQHQFEKDATDMGILKTAQTDAQTTVSDLLQKFGLTIKFTNS